MSRFRRIVYNSSMNRQVSLHIHNALKHLYINPLEKCNLNCKMCYTRKSSPILKEEQILDFISRYQKAHQLDSITFCGGEVFTLLYFPGLVNRLCSKGPAAHVSQSRSSIASRNNSFLLHNLASRSQGEARFGIPHSRHPSNEFNQSLFIQIITNGTIDRLSEFENPNMVNLIVSIDGLPGYHDRNRGKGNFQKSINFLKKAIELGFHTEIFTIVTRQNYGEIEEFEELVQQELSSDSGGDPSTPPIRSGSLRMTPNRVGVTYHPRKPLSYLQKHPVSNIYNNAEGFDFLTDDETRELIYKKRTFPPKGFGCYQISLMSDGKVYGCCEGTIPIGSMDDDIKDLISKLEKKLEVCSYCPYPDFMCGMKEYMNL